MSEVKQECAGCGGLGEIEVRRDVTPSEETGGLSELTGWIKCENCDGNGFVVLELDHEESAS